MGFPFTDITVYSQTPFEVGTTQYWEEISLINFISELYCRNMNGYKPPKTSRITSQPGYHKECDRSWKNGSIVAIAPFFSHQEFSVLDKLGQYKYILDLIQTSTIQLSKEYEWDIKVFENTYKKIIDSNFDFNIEMPIKQSRDRNKKGKIFITKTETVTSCFVEINNNGSIITKKLFDKKNFWFYDCIYYLAKNNKWFDNDRFGISSKIGKIEIWYSIENDEIKLFENGRRVRIIDFI